MSYMPRKCAKCEQTFHGGDMYAVLDALLCHACTMRGLIDAAGTFGVLRALGLSPEQRGASAGTPDRTTPVSVRADASEGKP